MNKKEEEIRAKYLDEIILDHLDPVQKEFALLLKQKFPGMKLNDILDKLIEELNIDMLSEDEEKLDENDPDYFFLKHFNPPQRAFALMLKKKFPSMRLNEIMDKVMTELNIDKS